MKNNNMPINCGNLLKVSKESNCISQNNILKLKTNQPKINLDKISKKFLKDKEKEFVLKK